MRLTISFLAFTFLTGTFLSCSDAFAQELTLEKFEIPATDDGLPGEGPIRRVMWFNHLWKMRRSMWDSQVKQDQQAVVFLGDSITQGWGEDIGGAFGDLKVANRGISGDTTRGMLVRLKEDVLALNPQAVVMLMGTNDLGMDATPQQVAANVNLIVAALNEHNPEMPIILCQIFPSSASMQRPTDKIQKANELCMAAVRGNKTVTVLDTFSLFANAAGDAKKEEFPDLLHPNKVGYAKWAAALKPLLATLGFLETTEMEFTLEPGYESLFNGKDLTGWGYQVTPPRKPRKNPNPAAPVFAEIKEPVTFDSQTVSSDGRYVAKNGKLIVTTPTEGRRIQQLWTTREFPTDFTLKLEFRATPNADSGVFIRKPQLQCRDYPLAGPYKDLKNYKPQDWNELVVKVSGKTAHCTCNGELLEAAFEVPETGPIGLEGDRGQMEYRRIRIKTEQ